MDDSVGLTMGAGGGWVRGEPWGKIGTIVIEQQQKKERKKKKRSKLLDHKLLRSYQELGNEYFKVSLSLKRRTELEHLLKYYDFYCVYGMDLRVLGRWE